MKKEIRLVDETRKIVQVTSVDERWYCKDTTDPNTGLPTYVFVPSVTWICDYYPKGIGYYKWLANKGWDEAEAIKNAAAEKGSKVHQAVASLIDGNSIPINAQLKNPDTGNLEEITLEEYDAIRSFADWHKETKPDIIERDLVVFNQENNYAGTTDIIYLKEEYLYVLDIKTSQYVWPTHALQVSAYSHAPEIQELAENNKVKGIKLAILQLGYRLNKKQFKFTEVEDKFVEFIAAQTIWANENNDVKPQQKDYPLVITLD